VRNLKKARYTLDTRYEPIVVSVKAGELRLSDGIMEIRCQKAEIIKARAGRITIEVEGRPESPQVPKLWKKFATSEASSFRGPERTECFGELSIE